MSPEQIAGSVLFFLTVSGVLWGIWWKISAMVDTVRKDASHGASTATALAHLAREELAQHKLHAAETFITKEGLRDVKDEIMDAIHGVKAAIDTMGGRIDGMYQTGAVAPRTRAK